MYKIINGSPIHLSHMALTVNEILTAINTTNSKFKNISDMSRSLSVDIFKIMDLRVLSGVIGETFVAELSQIVSGLKKNPSIDGYPDLLQVVNQEMENYYNIYASMDSKDDFLYGGIEVKNTLGYKKPKVDLFTGEQRIDFIQPDLQWKAHHRKTNHLLGFFSDFINGYPTIVAAFYSDQLTPDDWTAKANPKEGSAMTSFSTITKDGYSKMLSGIILCLDDPKYLSYFGQEA